MKLFRILPVVILLLLPSCLPKKPEIPMTEVPAGPYVDALEQRNRAFSGLKAIAGIRIAKKERKRTFESVGVLIKGQERFRIEAYGPIGQTVITLVWDGNVMLIDVPGERRIVTPNSSVLERMLGADIDPSELCAILSGNIPTVQGSEAQLSCAPGGKCILELRRDDSVARLHTDIRRLESMDPTVPLYERYRGGRLVYQVRFDSFEEISGYAFPKKIIVENPGKRLSLAVQYDEAEVNVPIGDQAFTIPSPERP